jgi:hypothetical protein
LVGWWVEREFRGELEFRGWRKALIYYQERNLKSGRRDQAGKAPWLPFTSNALTNPAAFT